MRERRRVLAVVSVTLLAAVVVWFNYSALLPLVAADWGLSGVAAGAVFAAFQAGYVLAVLPAGRLADRASPRLVVAGGAAGTGLASLGFAAVATGPVSGAALRFVGGCFMAGVYVPGMRLVSDWFPPEARGRAMGAYVGAFSLATGLSFLLSSAVAAAVDWRAGVAATGALAVLAAPLPVVLLRDHPDAVSASPGFDLAVVRDRAYLYAVGAYAGHSWEVFAVRNWLPAFLVTLPAVAGSDSPTLTAGLLTGVTLSLGGFGNLGGGWASDRLGRARTVVLALGASAAVSLSLGAVGPALPFPALVALLVVYGVVLVADSAPASTVVTETVADEHVGVALALQSVVGFAATTASPVVFGAALDAGGFAAAFPTLAAGALCGAAAMLLHARSRDAPTAGGETSAA
ncbi:MAG: MFS transporter [Haloferacaceae archaeon]